MNKYIIIAPIVFTTMSCATQNLYLNVTQPAPVTLSKEIKTVGIIDRSTPTDQTRILDAIDKVVSLEGADLDQIGTAESIRGVKDELMNNNRFTSVKVLSELEFKASNFGTFPTPLTWEQVDGICRDSGTDALFALEMYDTDTRLNYTTGKTQIKTPLGNIPAIEHIASMETLVKTGWRIYSPADRAILDEHLIAESIVFTGRGINPLAAATALLNRKDAVKEVSNKAGHIYAIRLLPYQIRVTRDYYVKGTNNFKIAMRKARVGKWDEAGELWNRETENPKMKVAGRACYNMAIINEINGDLESAIGWAQRAYENYKNRLALHYVHILENRSYNNEILRLQETDR